MALALLLCNILILLEMRFVIIFLSTASGSELLCNTLSWMSPHSRFSIALTHLHVCFLNARAHHAPRSATAGGARVALRVSRMRCHSS